MKKIVTVQKNAWRSMACTLLTTMLTMEGASDNCQLQRDLNECFITTLKNIQQQHHGPYEDFAINIALRLTQHDQSVAKNREQAQPQSPSGPR